jgi:signal peptidase II
MGQNGAGKSTLFAVGKVISHRIAGPLYAFEKFLDDILVGKDRSLKLRSGDDFKHLEELAEKIREEIKKRPISEIKKEELLP